MELTGAAFTLVGLVRQANEDSSMVADGLVAVADGMGGHLAGEVASADTVTTLQAVVGMREPGELVGAVHLANRRIHDRAAENPELHGMGTTVCVLGTVVDDGNERLMALNVGDSRIYHYGSGVLTQLTEDHSLVEALVRDGRLTPEEAEVHPQRNVLTRALGVEAVVEVDAWLLTPADGDRFLLCSDGLFNEITNQQIAEVLESAKDPDTAARILAERAETAGGRDNITTVVVDITGTGLAAGPVGDRVRRVVVPPTDLSDIEALLVAAQDESDESNEIDDVDTTANFPPVVAMLADDDAAFEVETPAEAAARDAADDLLTADDEPVVVADAIERDGWRSKLFLLAVVAVVLIGVAAIVVGIIASGSDSPTTTTVRPTTTSTTSSTASTATTLPVVTVPTTLPLTPAPPVTAAPTAPGT